MLSNIPMLEREQWTSLSNAPSNLAQRFFSALIKNPKGFIVLNDVLRNDLQGIFNHVGSLIPQYRQPSWTVTSSATHADDFLSKGRKDIPAHTEGSEFNTRLADIIALYCMQPAAYGGETLACSFNDIEDYFSGSEITALQTVPVEHCGLRKNAAGEPIDRVVSPILSHTLTGEPSLRISTRSLKEAREKGMLPPEIYLLAIKLQDLFTERAERISLAKNQLLFIHNPSTLHARNAYVDNPDAPPAFRALSFLCAGFLII